MTTPHAIRSTIEQWQQNGEQPSGEMIASVVNYCLQLLPPEVSGGKTCLECGRKMHNRCTVKCPHCHSVIRTTTTPSARRRAGQNPPEPTRIQHDNCPVCDARVEEHNEQFRLTCGCIYHIDCLRRIGRRPRINSRKCWCNEIDDLIPEQFWGEVSTTKIKK